MTGAGARWLAGEIVCEGGNAASYLSECAEEYSGEQAGDSRF
jgi:hypothetical protein